MHTRLDEDRQHYSLPRHPIAKYANFCLDLDVPRDIRARKYHVVDEVGYFFDKFIEGFDAEDGEG